MPEEFYVVEAQALEWVYVITKLVGAHEPKVNDVSMTQENGNVIYYIRKSLIPPEHMAKALGVSPEAVSAAKARIVLKKLVDESGLPKPTVNYIGEA